MARIQEQGQVRREQGREQPRVGLVGDRRHDQHDEIGARDRLGDVGRHRGERHESRVNAAQFDAAMLPDRLQPIRVAGLQPHREAAACQIGRGGIAAMAGAQDGDGLDGHFRKSLVKTWLTSSLLAIRPISTSAFCIDSQFAWVE